MMTPSEVEFLSENEMITIVPNFSYNKIFLISGDVGPFVASIPTKVPLWLAINLKQRQKCRIVPPEWMDVEKLEEARQNETESPVFTKMPSDHFIEITERLLDCAASDIPHADEIRTLVKDIWDLRMAKLRTSMNAIIQTEATHAALDHLTLMELNSVRPFLLASLNGLHFLKENTRGSSQPSQE